MDKKDIKDFTAAAFIEELHRISEPRYRALQIFGWVYKKGISDFDSMSDLSRPCIDKLKKFYYISKVKLADHLKSADRTEKIIFELEDKKFIETVLIYSGKRKTLCLSSQVGCKYMCLFCASGANGFSRNLSVSEILNQIIFFQHKLKHNITNLVFMGMGEPLDNYENVAKAIVIMNSAEAMAIAARRITVSTCGIIPGIEKFKDIGLQVNLSISLHAVNDKLRDKLMPINKRYPLGNLIKACEDYIRISGRMVTLEYVLINGINDSKKHADDLSGISKRLRAKVNLIPYSPVCGLNFRPPDAKDMDTFKKRLNSNRINVTVRESKGKDINAACGQLAGRFTHTPKRIYYDKA